MKKQLNQTTVACIVTGGIIGLGLAYQKKATMSAGLGVVIAGSLIGFFVGASVLYFSTQKQEEESTFAAN